MPEWICQECLDNLKYDPEIKTILNYGRALCYFCKKIAKYLVILGIEKENNATK